MNAMLKRALTLAGSVSLLTPAALLAHDGHAGHHGWLAGAAQPLLSLDHLLAALFVVVWTTLGVAWLARRGRGGLPRQP